MKVIRTLIFVLGLTLFGAVGAADGPVQVVYHLSACATTRSSRAASPKTGSYWKPPWCLPALPKWQGCRPGRATSTCGPEVRRALIWASEWRLDPMCESVGGSVKAAPTEGAVSIRATRRPCRCSK